MAVLSLILRFLICVTPTHPHLHIHTHTQTNKQTHTRTHTRTHTLTHTHTYARIHARMHARTHTNLLCKLLKNEFVLLLHLLNQDKANTIACSIVCSRLDYCNNVLYGVTALNISRLQRVHNTLARVVCDAPYRSSATNLPRSLYWLPIAERITYKIATLTFKVRLHRRPVYLAELVIDHTPSRSLRSSMKELLVESKTKTKIASRAYISQVEYFKAFLSIPGVLGEVVSYLNSSNEHGDDISDFKDGALWKNHPTRLRHLGSLNTL